VTTELERLVIGQAEKTNVQDMPWHNAGASLIATREHILLAMKDLCDNATDTVWLTKYETVFERLASIYGYAGGDTSVLADIWPEYFN